MKNPRKPSKRTIARGLALKGMEAHINRLKASWRNYNPSDEVLDRWIRFKVAKMITAEMLRVYTTAEMIDLYENLAGEE